MPLTVGLATPCEILSSVVTHPSFEREYVGRDVYLLDDRPGFFRRVKAAAKRTLVPHNDDAVIAAVEDADGMKMAEFVPFKELYQLMKTMADPGQSSASVAVPQSTDD